ncbi:MAG: hypothetical protein CMN77_08145 [Spirochaetaceae bacterium]|nr:hypothetical protein [Spirochaetaceae bacterium]
MLPVLWLNGLIILMILSISSLRPQVSGSLSPEDTDGGRRLFEHVCGKCHTLPNPNQKVPGGWTVTVRRMEGYRRRQGMPALSARELRAIRDYLEYRNAP